MSHQVKDLIFVPVSYTHLDVYKRQLLIVTTAKPQKGLTSYLTMPNLRHTDDKFTTEIFMYFENKIKQSLYS